MFYWLFAALLAAAGVVALVSFVAGEERQPLKWVGDRCDTTGYGCTVFNQLLFTAAPLAIGFIVFLAWRYRRIPGLYIRRARESPESLVETAGGIVGEIVGRDDLCDVLQTELRDEDVRRPHVLVGGLGIGKTAVLVKLTSVLARRGAVPVAVRLRDAEEEIDFLELARTRFLTLVGRHLRSADEGDRIWKQLVKDDRVIVLADGLEEAFADEEAGRARHHRVRVAVRRAHDRKFPLVIASRPHEALRALDAALVHVEPLSEEAALNYIQAGAHASECSFEELIELADVTETPLYLQIARDLHDEDLLEQTIDLGVDRLTMRRRLLREWVEALESKKLHRTQRVPLNEAERRATVAHLAALACMGLREDTQQVLFDAWDAEVDPTADEPTRERQRHQTALRRALRTAIEKRIEESDEQQPAKGGKSRSSTPIAEVQAAASKGFRLGLVEPLTNGVRFPHSIIQAYLGATMFAVVFADALLAEKYLHYALQDPGREFLLALVMYSRMRPEPEPGPASRDRSQDERQTHSDVLGPWRRSLSDVTKKLTDAGRAVGSDAPERGAQEGKPAAEDERPERPLGDDKRLDVLATAIEIDTEYTIEQNLPRSPLYERGPPGGAIADLTSSWASLRASDDTTQDAKARLIVRLGESAHRLVDADGEGGRSGPLYRCLYDIASEDADYRIRLAAAQEIGSGGDAAWTALRETCLHADEPKDEDKDYSGWTNWNRRLGRDGEALQRECDLKGWVLPMLLGSVSDECRSEVDERLKQWVRHVARGMPLSLEAALAQGFKHAANRRPHHSHENSESRTLLQRHATEMIYRAQFWYARVTLIHALTLWELARIVYPGHIGHEAPDRPRDTRSLVTRWLRRLGEPTQEQHPFVLEAAELAQKALDSRQPTRYLWIDESGIVTKVGSRPEAREVHGRKSLWIAPSAGWIALDGRAQQLVGDILILLNLAERGEPAQERDERLDKANDDRLPLCLTEDRCPYLKPSQTVGRADIPNPGQDCKARCPVALCPYPPRGQQAYRVELSEAFCRRQQVGLARYRLLAPDVLLRPRPWQQGPRAELRRFWAEMEERARKG